MGRPRPTATWPRMTLASAACQQTRYRPRQGRRSQTAATATGPYCRFLSDYGPGAVAASRSAGCYRAHLVKTRQDKTHTSAPHPLSSHAPTSNLSLTHSLCPLPAPPRIPLSHTRMCRRYQKEPLSLYRRPWCAHHESNHRRKWRPGARTREHTHTRARARAHTHTHTHTHIHMMKVTAPRRRAQVRKEGKWTR